MLTVPDDFKIIVPPVELHTHPAPTVKFPPMFMVWPVLLTVPVNPAIEKSPLVANKLPIENVSLPAVTITLL